jgi:hypothetical protein
MGGLNELLNPAFGNGLQLTEHTRLAPLTIGRELLYLPPSRPRVNTAICRCVI